MDTTSDTETDKFMDNDGNGHKDEDYDVLNCDGDGNDGNAYEGDNALQFWQFWQLEGGWVVGGNQGLPAADPTLSPTISISPQNLFFLGSKSSHVLSYFADPQYKIQNIIFYLFCSQLDI